MKKSALILFLFSLGFMAYISSSQAAQYADEVIVYKAKRIMEIKRDNQVIRRYRIALGFNPVGHKLYEGDGRTPVGRYFLNWRNPESAFHKSINISYPDAADKAVARALGHEPGNLIMIHGLPNEAPEYNLSHPNEDWTNGCIALTNEEMDEIWSLVRDGTPILIKP